MANRDYDYENYLDTMIGEISDLDLEIMMEQFGGNCAYWNI
jgi:hypothetical protein